MNDAAVASGLSLDFSAGGSGWLVDARTVIVAICGRP